MCKALVLISSREGDGVITQDLVKSQISFTLVYSILYYPYQKERDDTSNPNKKIQKCRNSFP